MNALSPYLWAFLVGGLLCVIAQLLLDRTALSPARILVGYVVAGVLLGAIGLYGPLTELAGAGATTPLSGFGNLIAKGIRRAIDEQGAIGILTGSLSAASAGTTAALCLGFLAALISKGRPK